MIKNLILPLMLLYTFPAFALDKEHGKWSALLSKYTEAKGLRTFVHYGEWKKAGVKDLDHYLQELSHYKKEDFNKLSSHDQLAFLINAYNAFTVKLILNHYPLKSIKDAGTALINPWQKKFFYLLGEEMNLDHIEHEMIRKDFKEPRIHFAVNCASIGCPELLREAFVGHKLENQLAQVEKSFFLNPEKMKFSKNKILASQILEWYGGDFGDVKLYITKKGKELGLLKKNRGHFKLEFIPYDWDLNGK